MSIASGGGQTSALVNTCSDLVAPERADENRDRKKRAERHQLVRRPTENARL